MRNRIYARISRALNPGFSSCRRCGVAWPWTTPHHTRYTAYASCFPLCCGCWRGLTPDQRLPFYQQLWHGWLFVDPSVERVLDWLYIEYAVRQGL